MGTILTVIPWGRGHISQGYRGDGELGSNADGNTAVKWKKDEHCSQMTLLPVCWSCMDSKLCSIELKTG